MKMCICPRWGEPLALEGDLFVCCCCSATYPDRRTRYPGKPNEVYRVNYDGALANSNIATGDDGIHPIAWLRLSLEQYEALRKKKDTQKRKGNDDRTIRNQINPRRNQARKPQ